MVFPCKFAPCPANISRRCPGRATLAATIPLGRDCIKVAEGFLLESHWADQSSLNAWSQAAKEQVEEAVAGAQREPLADPNSETWCPYATAKIADALLVR